jgi:hypothetical protein
MSGTMRGTPSRGQNRGAIPFQTSPAANSGIPRPVNEGQGSEIGPPSTLSASRQKQSKRDEVCSPAPYSALPLYSFTSI